MLSVSGTNAKLGLICICSKRFHTPYLIVKAKVETNGDITKYPIAV